MYPSPTRPFWTCSMTDLHFEKYQGTGNDFIFLEGIRSLPTPLVQQLCDRRFGIGADGLILMNRESDLDFDMLYYNSDGSQSFCGNGSRCAVRFAQRHQWISDSCRFNSNDGSHYALIESDRIKLQMHDVKDFEQQDDHALIHTGSPHYLCYAPLSKLDIIPSAHAIRYSKRFEKEGVNVNFLEAEGELLNIRTYERGVENETLSCGTGVTAAALAHHLTLGKGDGSFSREVRTLGGNLTVEYTIHGDRFSRIFLCGPAEFVYSGNIEVSL